MSYYGERLSGERLKQCYDIAPPRVQQYLQAELNHVLESLSPDHVVLELGCGYGRILAHIARKVRHAVGIDISLGNLQLGQKTLAHVSDCSLLNMDAMHLAFRENVFDRVICVQNGISAFHVNQHDLIRESLRVAKSGGIVLFSTYSSKFWAPRLKWFEMQSQAGLLGPIDYQRTGNGRIVCTDGFTATTVEPDQFRSLVADLDVDTRVTEVDDSSVFYEILC